MKDKTDKGYHRLLVWQKAKLLVGMMYKYTETFPRAEEFGLKGQVRRAMISVVLNIVEGYRRKSTKEFLRFLDIAQSSLTEVEACLELCYDLKYLKESELDLIEERRSEVAFMLHALIKSIKNKS